MTVEEKVGHSRNAHSESLLTREGEVELFRRIEAARAAGGEGPTDQSEHRAAVTTLVELNQRLVYKVAARYRNRGLPLSDLVQEGNIGLLSAIEKFDYRLGYRFSTYATWWIRQSISRSAMNVGRSIRVPVHMIEAVRNLLRERQQLAGQLERDPTEEELAEHTRLPLSRVRKMLGLVAEPISLDNPVGEDESACLGDFIPDRGGLSPEDNARAAILESQIRRVLQTLTPREEAMIRLRFGIGCRSEHTLAEIGRLHQVTRERIRQIEHKALRKLRHPIRSHRLRELV